MNKLRNSFRSRKSQVSASIEHNEKTADNKVKLKSGLRRKNHVKKTQNEENIVDNSKLNGDKDQTNSKTINESTNRMTKLRNSFKRKPETDDNETNEPNDKTRELETKNSSRGKNNKEKQRKENESKLKKGDETNSKAANESTNRMAKLRNSFKKTPETTDTKKIEQSDKTTENETKSTTKSKNSSKGKKNKEKQQTEEVTRVDNESTSRITKFRNSFKKKTEVDENKAIEQTENETKPINTSAEGKKNKEKQKIEDDTNKNKDETNSRSESTNTIAKLRNSFKRKKSETQLVHEVNKNESESSTTSSFTRLKNSLRRKKNEKLQDNDSEKNSNSDLIEIELAKDTLTIENAKSPNGRCTPVLGWSPLPQKRQLSFATAKSSKEKENKVNDVYLYPNCDFNIWLRSCEQEIIKPLSGTVKGTIPTWLNGSLMRNGPGSLKVGNMEFQHLFDSSALLHRFAIKDGNVTYQCRFLRSDVYKRNQAAQRIVLTEFGTVAVPDPCQTIFQKVASAFDNDQNMSDNAMISIYPFGDEIYAFTESPIIHQVNKTSLETEKRIDIRKHVSIINHTSHPHVLNDETVFNIGMSTTATGVNHSVLCFPPKSKNDDKSMFDKARIVASVPTRWPFHPSYMHTFGITDNYYIIIEQPLSVSVTGIVTARLKNEPMASCFRWYSEEKTLIHLLSRKTGQSVFKFYSDAFFYLHVINQYEMEDYVVLDICCYKDPSMLDCMYIETMKGMHSNPDYSKMFKSRPLRFILPLLNAQQKKVLQKDKNLSQQNLIKLPNTTARAFLQSNGKVIVKPELLCDLGCETPRIYYERHLGKKYKYFYAISSDVDCDNPGTIIKVDTENKTAVTWCEENCYPSEPIFVASPDPKSEDDGVIISALLWGKELDNKVGLLVLDAQTFQEIGRTEFTAPGPVPKCLHGWFLNHKT